ncbi:MAG: hypothetical protein ACLRSW_12225 [Christensenellaceae bacterium]
MRRAGAADALRESTRLEKSEAKEKERELKAKLPTARESLWSLSRRNTFRDLLASKTLLS